jgi:hypothetical protein
MLCKGEGSALDPHVPRKVEGALDVALVAVQVIAWSENRAWHTSGYFQPKSDRGCRWCLCAVSLLTLSYGTGSPIHIAVRRVTTCLKQILVSRK